MATNLTFNNVTLPLGVSTPLQRNMNKEHDFLLTVDRTVAGGLNSLDQTTTLEVDVNSSSDGGNTFQNEASFTTTGGTFVGRGGTLNTNVLAVEGLGGQGTVVQIVTTVGGPSAIVVSGSIALTG